MYVLACATVLVARALPGIVSERETDVDLLPILVLLVLSISSLSSRLVLSSPTLVHTNLCCCSRWNFRNIYFSGVLSEASYSPIFSCSPHPLASPPRHVFKDDYKLDITSLIYLTSRLTHDRQFWWRRVAHKINKISVNSLPNLTPAA